MAFKQETQTSTLQSAVSANGNGVAGTVDGFNGAQLVEVVETNGGTCTIALQGSFDGVNWYVLGYQLLDNTAAPARAIANLSVLANTHRVYQVLDPYFQIRAVVSAVAANPIVTVKVYATGT